MAGSPTAPRVGLALIAKNEAERLPRLLASITNAFDRVVLLDTGSDDDTVKNFVIWAEMESQAVPEFTWQVGHVHWGDDFAKARRQADNLLTHSNPTDDRLMNLGPSQVDWRAWADCDDVIEGAHNIRRMVEVAPPHVAAFLVDYDYAQHPDTGACLSYLRRERVVRVGASTWHGRVHEAQIIEGGMIQQVAPEVLIYRHRKHMGPEVVEESNGRNLRILEKWNADEPDNPRVLAYLGVENAIRGNHEPACVYYERFIALHTDWDQERAQVFTRYAASLLALERSADAISACLEAMRVDPSWPDSYLRIAEGYLAQDQYDKTIHWAQQAVVMGPPENTLLIVNPLDYGFQPRKVLAGALGGLRRFDEAMEIGRQAMEMFPDAELGNAMRQWSEHAKREHTASTYAMCAEQLIAHDEQIKALTLLEQCVPVFATDHPRIVGLRSMLRERLMWVHDPVSFSDHYETGGSKPEDFITDENIDPLCEYLPRTNFLLDGVCEQAGVK